MSNVCDVPSVNVRLRSRSPFIDCEWAMAHAGRDGGMHSVGKAW
jgi:hypothetical protein